jgi:small redox-active disulfide protein 2
MKVEILGTGCPKCKTLTTLVTKTVEENGIVADISKVEDLKTIISYGVMSTPALVIDGKVVLSGRVPNINELTQILSESDNGCCKDNHYDSKCGCVNEESENILSKRRKQMKITQKTGQLLHAFLMAILLPAIMLFVITAINVGFTAQFFNVWAHNYIIAVMVAFPLIIFLSPLIKNFISKISS